MRLFIYMCLILILMKNRTWIDKKLLQFMTTCQQTPLCRLTSCLIVSILWCANMYLRNAVDNPKNSPKATTCKISLSKNFTRICTYLSLFGYHHFPLPYLVSYLFQKNNVIALNFMYLFFFDTLYLRLSYFHL